MDFEYPPGFSQMPPEVKEDVMNWMIQKKIIAMHISDCMSTQLINIVNAVGEVCDNPKFKNIKEIQTLQAKVNMCVGRVNNEVEKYKQIMEQHES